MKKSTLIWFALIVVVIGLVLWSNMQKPSTKSELVPSAAYTLGTGTNSVLGTYLTASNGMTLYRFTKDTPGVSTCVGACATNWPAYTVSAATSITHDEVVSGAIATITRAGGTMQLTYKGMPLYFWHNDVKPGDTLGQNFGGVWFVVNP